MSRFVRSLGPAVARPPLLEAFRAGLGAFVGLGVAGLFVLSPLVDLRLGLYLIAPFGASAVLLFAVPNSPLAQPWSAIVGNGVAAIVGVTVCLFIADPVLRISLAVGLAITAMIVCRAVHPPAGAVAMTAAMSPEAIADLGFRFVLAPVLAGTLVLVVVAMIFNRLTGRRYPFRQFDTQARPGTPDPLPTDRLGLSEEELTAILEKYRQSFNLGVEDLARLIGAAELQAATHRTGPMTVADIMSTNLVTIPPDAPLSDVADLFRRHNFTSLPVIGPKDTFLGIIFQIHLITCARDSTLRFDHGFRSAMRRLIDGKREAPLRAEAIMNTTGPRVASTVPIAALVPLMAAGDVDAVPVLEDERVIGIVTRTDLIRALARKSLQ